MVGVRRYAGRWMYGVVGSLLAVLVGSVGWCQSPTPLDTVITTVRDASEGMITAVVSGLAGVILLGIGVTYVVNTLRRRMRSA